MYKYLVDDLPINKSWHCNFVSLHAYLKELYNIFWRCQQLGGNKKIIKTYRIVRPRLLLNCIWKTKKLSSFDTPKDITAANFKNIGHLLQILRKLAIKASSFKSRPKRPPCKVFRLFKANFELPLLSLLSNGILHFSEIIHSMLDINASSNFFYWWLSLKIKQNANIWDKIYQKRKRVKGWNFVVF